MNRLGFISALIFILALSAGAGCRKAVVPDPLPEVSVGVKPGQGLTTDIIEITITPQAPAKTGQELFYRWDWDNDGSWDNPFSTGNQMKHRFLSPGMKTVRIEYADGMKQTDIKIIQISIRQGFSAPHPDFRISPGKGNILTEFHFDAGITRDDEDSLDQLMFRWDYKGEGIWNQQFSKNPEAIYRYTTPGIYQPKLEVKDPTGRTALVSHELIITMEDTLIIPVLTCSDTLIRIGDTILIGASGSYHSADKTRKLLYSWLLPERVEWTTPAIENQLTVIMSKKGSVTFGLKAIDRETGLFNQVVKELYVADENLPPKAKIRAGSIYGNILTRFYFDAWASSDDWLAPSELKVRWDFNGDGSWDTPYSKDKEIHHQYDQPGTYMVGLEVTDDNGAIGRDYRAIIVSGNTNETGYFKDPRDDRFYGTVKIGDQWWMSQNLNFEVPEKVIEHRFVYQHLCLFEKPSCCDQFGKLYHIGAVVMNRADDELVTVCPTGWRLPARSDWETLFTTIGGEQNAKELRQGGKFDFNALDLGYADYYFIYRGITVVDTVFQFKDTYQNSWFFSTTEPYDPNHTRVDIWQWEIDRATENLWKGYGSTELYMQVRCIKEN